MNKSEKILREYAEFDNAQKECDKLNKKLQL